MHLRTSTYLCESVVSYRLTSAPSEWMWCNMMVESAILLIARHGDGRPATKSSEAHPYRV